MEHERRRDRVWKFILNQFRQTGRVSLSDFDVSLETKPLRRYEDALAIVENSDSRTEDDIRKDPGGEYIVELSPDASDGTKRHVLETMTGTRYQLAQRVEDEAGTWEIGPHLEYLFGQRDETPIDNPLGTEYEADWENVGDYEMYSERRRDRLWFYAINTLAQDKNVHTQDMDASMTVVTDEKSTAYRLIEQESYRGEEDIIEEDGQYVVAIEPDVSPSTKLSLVKTLEKSRYSMLSDAGHYDGWEPGPWARAIFDLDIHSSSNEVPENQTTREYADDVISDTSLSRSEQISTINTVVDNES